MLLADEHAPPDTDIVKPSTNPDEDQDSEDEAEGWRCHDTCHVPGLAPIFHFSFTITSPSLLPACALEGLLFYDVISLTHIRVPLLRPMTVILGLTHPSSLIYDMTSSSLTRCILSCL